MRVQVLAGCGSNEPATSAAPTPTPGPASAFIEPGLRFSQDAEQACLKALGKVDEQLAQDDDAVDHGKNICMDVVQGKSDARVIENAAARFEVDDVTAKQIVTATRTSLCKV